MKARPPQTRPNVVRIRRVRRSGVRPPEAIRNIVDTRKQASGDPLPAVEIGPFRITYPIALGFILLVAVWFRFVNLNWDDNLYLHPDERFLAQVVTEIAWPHDVRQYFDSATSPLNPFNGRFTNYLYGTFPIFLDKFVGSLFGQTAYGNIHLPGRALSALQDIGSLLFAAWAARMLFGRAISLLTAALFSLSVMNIQGAHFMTTDAAAAMFAIAAFALAIKSGRSGRVGWFALTGLAVGLAAASKPNLLMTAGFLCLPALELVRIHGWDALLPPGFRSYATQRIGKDRVPIALSTVIGIVIAALVFRTFQPYAFLGPHLWDFQLDPRWTSTLDYWRQAQNGTIDMPPSIQWADRAPYLFLLRNLVLWGMGPGLALSSLAGTVVLGFQMLRTRRWPSWWLLGLLGWIVLHLVFYGGGFVQVQRYLLPAYPFMIMVAAWLLTRLWNWARSGRISTARWPRWLHPGYVLPVLVVGSTLFYAAAFANSLYLHPHTRVEASEWVYDNLPVGSTLTSEHWDDGLPLRLPNEESSKFISVQLELYNTDNEEKLSTLVNQLDRADYIITSSNRLYGSIPRMPDRYPMTTAYYEALFNGELGFELIKTFEHPPELFGITLDDENADESLTVYDHPKVMIFEKTDRWSANATWLYLDQALGDGAINLKPIDVTPDQIMLSPGEIADYSSAGGWSSIFSRDSFTNKLPALWWYLILQALALPAIPILWRILPTLPDRGYALAKLTGLLGTTYLVWLLASLHAIRFSPLSIALCWFALCVVGVVVVNVRYRQFLDSLIQRWRWIVISEIIFLGGFLFSVWLRWLNPDLWHPARGGEKPMDFAFFNATIKSPYFPPYDPWFAGGAMHYYYWGFVPWAAITKVTGIVPEVAYNLAIPSLFALLLLLVWNAAATVIARSRRASSDPIRDWGALFAALLAPVFVGFAGNLDIARRIGRGEWGYPTLPQSVERFGGLGEIGHGIWNTLTVSRSLPTDAYWPSTRVIPGTINEFPYFSFLFADLHAHVMSLPIVAGSLVIAIAIVGLSPKNEPGARPLPLYSLGGWQIALPIAVLAGFVAGILVASNTWDFPPALALIGVAAFIASGTSTGWQFPWVSLRDTALFGAVTYVTGQALLFPYLSRYGSLPSGLEPAEETTRLADYVTIHGLMLFAIGGFLIAELMTLMKSLRLYGPAGWFTISMMLLVGASGIAIALVTGTTAICIMLLVAAIGLCALNRHLSPTHLFTFAMIALALGLTLFPERFRLANDIGRMNTVFKFYLHAWLLLGVASTVAIAQVFVKVSPGTWITDSGADRKAGLVGWIATRVWLAGLAFLVIAASMYPALATAPRLADRFNDLPPTLNGLTFMDAAVQSDGADGGQPVSFSLAGDHEAITWMQDNIAGSPVVLEAVLPQYHWAARVSIQTGLPTVLGWEWHEIQQRPGYGVWIQQRKLDIEYMFSADVPFSSIQPMLDEYRVRLIYVGDLERAVYPTIGLAKFDQAVDQGLLTIIYQSDSTTIYAYTP